MKAFLFLLLAFAQLHAAKATGIHLTASPTPRSTHILDHLGSCPYQGFGQVQLELGGVPKSLGKGIFDVQTCQL